MAAGEGVGVIYRGTTVFTHSDPTLSAQQNDILTLQTGHRMRILSPLNSQRMRILYPFCSISDVNNRFIVYSFIDTM